MMKILQKKSNVTTTDDGTKSYSSGSESLSEILDITSTSTGDVEIMFNHQSGDVTEYDDRSIVSLPVIMPSNSRTGKGQTCFGLTERYKRWYEKWRERKELEAEETEQQECRHENNKTSQTRTTIMKSSSTLKAGIVHNPSSESKRRRRKSHKNKGVDKTKNENNNKQRSKSKSKDLKLHRLVEDTKDELKACKTIFDTAFSAAVSKQLEILSSPSNNPVPSVDHDYELPTSTTSNTNQINASLRQKCKNLERERQSLGEKIEFDQKLIQDLQQEVKRTKAAMERYKNEYDRDRHLLSLTVRHLEADINSREIHRCQIEKENGQLKKRLEDVELKIKQQHSTVRRNDPETTETTTVTAKSSTNQKSPSIVDSLEEELIATKTEIAAAKRFFHEYVKKTEERRQNMKARQVVVVAATTTGDYRQPDDDDDRDDKDPKDERRRLEDDSSSHYTDETTTTTSASAAAADQSVRFEHLQRELDAFKAFADSIIVDKCDCDYEKSQ